MSSTAEEPGQPRVLEAPDCALSRRKYGRQASTYDYYSAAATWLRSLAVARLAPEPGDVVLDVGCGTGLNFAALQARIGPGGRLVAIDPCQEMLAQARERVERFGWRNVELVEAGAEAAPLPAGVDAVLLCMVHDVLRSGPVLERVLQALRPGGRACAAGAKFAAAPLWWAPLLNPLVAEVNEPCVTSFEGFDRPWTHLARLVPGLAVQVDPWDVTYVAVGRTPDEASCLPGGHM